MSRRLRTAGGFVVLFALLGLAAGLVLNLGDNINAHTASRIKVGMTKAQVQQIIGREPDIYRVHGKSRSLRWTPISVTTMSVWKGSNGRRITVEWDHSYSLYHDYYGLVWDVNYEQTKATLLEEWLAFLKAKLGL